MKTLRKLLAFSFLFPLLSAAAENEIPHLKVGAPIPEVTLRDAEDQPVKLRETIAAKPAVLIFYRGGWCPFCTKHLMALVEIKDELLQSGYQILAISTDQPAKIKKTPNREKLDYTLLSDSKMTAAKAFGISFQVPDDLVSKYKNEYQIDFEAASGETHHLLPHPAVFIVSKDGVIRFAHVNPDYKTRLDPQAILKAVNGQKVRP
jgi:peroxiredoxin